MAAAGSLALMVPRVSAQTLISVEPSTRFQTINGWECVSFASQDDPAFERFEVELLDRVINEAGINRVRLEVRSGTENTTDYFAQYQSGQIEYAIWRANRYATVNDNADPKLINPAGYHFSELDRNMQTVVLPLRIRAAAKGEPLYINLNYVAFTGQITAGGSYHHADAEEYAEFILAVFQHMDQRWGFVPDAVEILLEPDNVGQWSGTAVGRAMVTMAARLHVAGYSPEIVAPSCTNMGNAVSYFDAIAAVPGATAVLDEICYHRYGGVSDANLQAIASRALQHGLRTSMLEWWNPGNGIDILLKDLVMGGNAAWQQGALGGMGGLDDGMALYKIDVTDSSAPQVLLNRKTRLLRQVYRFVRRGAVRVAATSMGRSVQSVAFVNADGGHVVIARTTAAVSLSIHGLPGGVYGINYSTESDFDVNLPDQAIEDDHVIAASIPASGAITVYQVEPRSSATTSNAETFEINVRSLKPGFKGIIERTTDLDRLAVWEQVGIVPPSDFAAVWTGPVGISSALFRFRQL